MIYAVTHRTKFRYEHPVRFARCNLRLRPIDWPGQVLEDHDLAITPHAERVFAPATGYPVEIDRIMIDTPARELVIESRSRLRVDRAVPTPRADDPTVGEIAAAAIAVTDLSPRAPGNFLFPSPWIPLDEEITDWSGEMLGPDRGIVEALLALACRIKAEFRYDGEATTFDTPVREAFEKRHGVCQDFAQVMIAAGRAAGLPCAYVSGYLRTRPPPGKPRLVGVDATHAWMMAWCGPALGWVGFDPTNGCAVGGDHIVTAVGRDYGDVAPIDGVFMGQDGQDIDVSVDVLPVEGED